MASDELGAEATGELSQEAGVQADRYIDTAVDNPAIATTYCRQYAKKGVAQYVTAIAARCNISAVPARWVAKIAPQEAWCNSVSNQGHNKTIPARETRERAKVLAACLGVAVPDNAQLTMADTDRMGDLLHERATTLVTQKRLLAAGADPRYVTSIGNGGPLVHTAAKFNQTDKALFAIKLQLASVNSTSNGGSSALIHATKFRNYTLMRALLQAGAQPDYLGERGWAEERPLAYAVTNGDATAVSILLQSGKPIDVNTAATESVGTCANKPDTLLDVANKLRTASRATIVQALRNRGAKSCTQM